MYCASCRAYREVGSKHCPSCGIKLIEAGVECASCGTGNYMWDSFCKECGKSIKLEVKDAVNKRTGEEVI